MEQMTELIFHLLQPKANKNKTWKKICQQFNVTSGPKDVTLF
jgi:hypothetical protein